MKLHFERQFELNDREIGRYERVYSIKPKRNQTMIGGISALVEKVDIGYKVVVRAVLKHGNRTYNRVIGGVETLTFEGAVNCRWDMINHAKAWAKKEAREIDL